MIPSYHATVSQGNGHNGADGQAILREINAYTSSLKKAWASVPLPRDVLDALQYIHDHVFQEETNVSYVCDACGLRNHNISSVFKKYVGVGMQKYIETHRIELAKILLGYDYLSILDITWVVGYVNPETFSRAFRRNEGCAPSDYRTSLTSRSAGRLTFPLAAAASNGVTLLD